MNGLSLASVSVLVHDCNNRASLRLGHATNCDDWEAGDLVVIDAADVHSTGVLGFVYDADIVTSQATIGATVD